MTFDAIDQLAVNTVRTLSIDAIQAANSGPSNGSCSDGLCPLESCNEC